MNKNDPHKNGGGFRYPFVSYRLVIVETNVLLVSLAKVGNSSFNSSKLEHIT